MTTGSRDRPPETRVGVAMIGHGTVGRGVVKLLADRAASLRRKTGLVFDLRHVVVRDPARHAAAAAGGVLPVHDDLDKALADPHVRVVLELAGGVDPAHQIVTRALHAGRHVVTANKALLAARGPELFAAARQAGVTLAFEASCGGGIPIVGALTAGLLANRVEALVGILNGTCNVILTAMTDKGTPYDDALADAQRQGFAEADPTLDVSGRDAAQKLAILTGLALGRRVAEADIHVEGIAGLDPRDIVYAGELGYVVKLLASARRDPLDDRGRLALSVFPGLLPKKDPMAEVKGAFNAVAVWGSALGHALFMGRGAGQMPTASAVVADLIQVAAGAYGPLFERLRVFPDTDEQAEVLPFDQTVHRYYLRLEARDVPGVFADVARCLGEAGISLSSVLQREAAGGNDGRDKVVPVVITTHAAREASVRSAVAKIGGLPGIVAQPVVLRIVDMPEELPPA